MAYTTVLSTPPSTLNAAPVIADACEDARSWSIRSSELLFARWREIDFRNWIWTISATRDAIVYGHGFRAMACSALKESELWSQDAVERQMSHQERNSVRAAYIHKAAHLEARKAMVQWWSDYLGACKGTYVLPYIWSREKNHKAA